MAEDRGAWEIIRVVLLCVAWYLISSGNNVVGKTLLNEFPYPMTVTMVQLLSIASFSSPVLRLMGVRPRSDISWSYYKRLIIPLAFGKSVSSVLSHVSIWRVPVSYAHTVKATMPLFTVLLGRILLGEKQTTKVYFSLFPIIIGVAIATITEISFDMLGLLSALMATGGFSLQNIYSKKVLTDTGLHHLRLLHLLGYLGLFMFLPVWVFTDGIGIIRDETLVVRRDPKETLILLLLDGGLNWMQNFVAFTILHYVTPLTYAVANATKRISIITISLLLLRNPVTLPNVVGMFMAILGVLGYNKAKYDANRAKKKAALVPLSQVTSSKHLHYPLQHPPFHPAYMFNHLDTARQGPYPRLTNGTSPALHASLQNGHLPSTKSIHTVSHASRSNGSIESI